VFFSGGGGGAGLWWLPGIYVVYIGHILATIGVSMWDTTTTIAMVIFLLGFGSYLIGIYDYVTDKKE
jgi:hypothetical protein